jgi:hypothetical protein
VRHSYGFRGVMDKLDSIGSLHHARSPKEPGEYVPQSPFEVRLESFAQKGFID